jgi:hypothetical protein
MSTVTVTYNFPEDREEFMTHQSAHELKSIINQVHENIRLHLKHGNPENHVNVLEESKQLLANVIFNDNLF